MTAEPTESFEDAKARFVAAVLAFRGWAHSYPVGERSSYWECDYEQWPAISSAVTAFLDAGGPQNWDASIIEFLLYALARDNEMEDLKVKLIDRPTHLLALARAGLHSVEPDARWQLADALGNVELSADEAEPLLDQLFQDEDEYVSRRALLALARRQSEKAESLALRAWKTEHEYQRMAALEALSARNSPLLSSFLDLAQRDGRQHLVNFANKLRAKQTSEDNQ